MLSYYIQWEDYNASQLRTLCLDTEEMSLFYSSGIQILRGGSGGSKLAKILKNEKKKKTKRHTTS